MIAKILTRAYMHGVLTPRASKHTRIFVAKGLFARDVLIKKKHFNIIRMAETSLTRLEHIIAERGHAQASAGTSSRRQSGEGGIDLHSPCLVAADVPWIQMGLRNSFD